MQDESVLNGTCKSSLLHALYGSPEGKSVEEFWYTTDLDPIKDLKDNRHCFIYSYKTEYSKTNAEILKTRIKKENNPDYWEPSRPIKKYGMNSLPEDADKREATKTRWNVLKKNVYHLDFRYSLSVYDKYFYFGSKPNTKTLKSKQDLIRKYAPKIRTAFEKGKNITYYSRKAFNVDTLSGEERECIEKILGKQYIETKFLEHNFYDKNKGFAIRYKTNSITYSEAYAGSGETAIVKLVIDLIRAEDYSLVLLDEPDIEFAVDGERGRGREDQKNELMLKYIKYHHDNVFFLPENIPEEIIWRDEVLSKADLLEEEKKYIKSESDYKKKFNLFAKYNFGGDSTEYQIKAYEYFLIRWIKKETDDCEKIANIINMVKEK